MERRARSRSEHRIPCEFRCGEQRYRGIAVDLSRSGLFIQTGATLEPGAEIEVALQEDPFRDARFRAVVVRRRSAPPMPVALIRPGLEVQIAEAPAALFGDLEEEPAAEEAKPVEAEDLEIEFIACDDVDPEPSFPNEAPAAPAPEMAASTLSVSEEAAREPLFPAAKGCAGPDPAQPAEGAALGDEPVPVESERQGGERAEPSRALYRSEALLIDGGELDDVHAMLVALGVDPVRHPGAGTEDFRDWEEPPRLVVVSARAASRLTLTKRPRQEQMVTMAVGETDSRTLRGMLRRQGFDFVVRRPVHPEALRLLLMTALYRGSERRSQTRLPVGCAIATRWGIRRRPATLLEISGRGCRFLGRETLKPETRVSIRIPGEAAGGHGLTLRGRVQRSERRGEESAEASTVVALRFDPLSQRTRRRLETLLAACATGPPSLPRTTEPSPRAPRAPVPPPGEGGESRRATRRHPRASFDREVVALDDRLERVRHVLFARDLSVGGVRVDPHPELRVGDRFALVLYDPTGSESIVIDAEVLRDDGERGLALRFLDVPESTTLKIGSILQRVGEIERRDAQGGSHQVIIAEVAQ